MEKKLVFMFLIASMGTSLAKSIAEESTMKSLNERSKDSGISRSANSGNGFNPGNTEGSGYNPGNQKPNIPDFVPEESITNQGNGGSGFNPGKTGGSGFNPGNQKPHIPDFVPDESITNQGNGMSGYNPGATGGSGFNPGNTGNGGSGFHPGSQRPDSPDESVFFFKNGGSGYNPAGNAGSGLNSGSPGGPGYNAGPKSDKRKKDIRNMTQFRRKILFADDADTDQPKTQVPIQSQTKSSLPPYQPGGDKTPYLRGNKQTKPASEENIPRMFLLQPVRQTKPFSSIAETNFQPFIQTLPFNVVSAQTLPSPIQFDQPAAKQPYVAGHNKQQYLRGRQTKPYQSDPQENDTPAYILLNPARQTKPFQGLKTISAQTLPSAIQFDELQEQLVFSPHILVQNPGSSIFAQTLPSPIQFDQSSPKQPYIDGQNNQQYLRGRQNKPYQSSDPQEKNTPAYNLLNPNPFQILPSPIQFDESQDKLAFSPQILVQTPSSGILAQTLPSPIQFDQPTAKQPYVAGQNKQQYLRGRQNKPYQSAIPQENYTPAYILLNPNKNTEPFLVENLNRFQTLPSPIQFDELQEKTAFSPQILVKNPSSGIFAQTLPSPIPFDQPAAKQPYVAGQNKQQYLRGRQTKPYQADPKEKNTPAYILLNSARQTKPFPADDQEIVSAQTLPSQIQFAEDEQPQPFLNFPPASRVAAQSGSPAGFLPGVSTRPRFPPGYTPAGVSRYAQAGVTRYTKAPELSIGGFGGPKTVLHIF